MRSRPGSVDCLGTSASAFGATSGAPPAAASADGCRTGGSARGAADGDAGARELALLVDRFREAAAGRGQVMFVAGDAGIGKSRLLHELRQAIAEAGLPATWLEGQCVSFGQPIPR